MRNRLSVLEIWADEERSELALKLAGLPFFIYVTNGSTRYNQIVDAVPCQEEYLEYVIYELGRHAAEQQSKPHEDMLEPF